LFVRDCTIALCFLTLTRSERALGLSGNYPDGSTGNLPFIPAHTKTFAIAARTFRFYTMEYTNASVFFRKSAVFSAFFCFSVKKCENADIYVFYSGFKTIYPFEKT
jgi:hypothetical protein